MAFFVGKLKYTLPATAHQGGEGVVIRRTLSWDYLAYDYSLLWRKRCAPPQNGPRWLFASITVIVHETRGRTSSSPSPPGRSRPSPRYQYLPSSGLISPMATLSRGSSAYLPLIFVSGVENFGMLIRSDISM